jgi:serine/threonine-protein kinase
MGEVYLAYDLRLHRLVALKVLKPDEEIDRFVLEARAASALNHPNVAHIYEIDQLPSGSDTVVYIAMEYVEGVTLEERLAKGPLRIEEALRIAMQIADPLSGISGGIVHRDLKPENIFLTNREGAPDFVKILDFGVAKMVRVPVAPRLGDPSIVPARAVHKSGRRAAARSTRAATCSRSADFVRNGRARARSTATPCSIRSAGSRTTRRVRSSARRDAELCASSSCSRREPSDRYATGATFCAI